MGKKQNKKIASSSYFKKCKEPMIFMKEMGIYIFKEYENDA